MKYRIEDAHTRPDRLACTIVSSLTTSRMAVKLAQPLLSAVLQNVMVYGHNVCVYWVSVSSGFDRICIPVIGQYVHSKTFQIKKRVAWTAIILTLIHLNKNGIFNRNHTEYSLVSFLLIIKQKRVKMY